MQTHAVPSAYRAALEKCTLEWVPLQWAETQNDLDKALAEIAGQAAR